MENNPLREEFSKSNTWEVIKFIGLATVISPSLVMEAGKDYIVNKIYGKDRD